MLSQTDQMPVLLLDDVLSELDSQRRQHLLDAIEEYQQVLVTATDPDRFPSSFLSNAARFIVENGTIKTDN
jgi:DNA replication and repair protein RecF